MTHFICYIIRCNYFQISIKIQNLFLKTPFVQIVYMLKNCRLISGHALHFFSVGLRMFIFVLDAKNYLLEQNQLLLQYINGCYDVKVVGYRATLGSQKRKILYKLSDFFHIPKINP